MVQVWTATYIRLLVWQLWTPWGYCTGQHYWFLYTLKTVTLFLTVQHFLNRGISWKAGTFLIHNMLYHYCWETLQKDGWDSCIATLWFTTVQSTATINSMSSCHWENTFILPCLKSAPAFVSCSMFTSHSGWLRYKSNSHVALRFVYGVLTANAVVLPSLEESRWAGVQASSSAMHWGGALDSVPLTVWLNQR